MNSEITSKQPPKKTVRLAPEVSELMHMLKALDRRMDAETPVAPR